MTTAGRRGESEYERVVATLTPLLTNLSPHELSDENLDFLADASGIPRQHVEWFGLAARGARASRVPSAAAFYGWFRQGLPTDWDSLRNCAITTLRAALVAAIEQHIISVPRRPDLNAVIAAVTDSHLQDLIEALALTDLSPSSPTLASACATALGRTVKEARDLASLDPKDWERVLAQVGSPPPRRMSASDYARRLAMAAVHAFPEAALRSRATRVSSGTGAAATAVGERVGWIQVVLSRNPDVSFLSLDYLPGSTDLGPIDFGTLTRFERQHAVRDLEAYQRVYAVAGNAIATVALIEAGYHSASAIARAPEAELAARAGLPPDEVRVLHQHARRRPPAAPPHATAEA